MDEFTAMTKADGAARMCPACGGESVVFRSMEKADGTIVRKRICKVCETKFETQEKFLRVLYMARQDRKSMLH